MKLCRVLCIALLSFTLDGLVAAVGPGRPGPRPGRKSGFVEEFCFTTKAKTRATSVPTISRTFTATYTLTHVHAVRPTTTVTPPTQTETTTSTSTQTSTTTTQVTDTSVSSVFSTIMTTVMTTSTSTSTSTSTTVSTQYQGTTTVPPRFQGFQGVDLTLPGAAAKRKRGASLGGPLEPRSENQTTITAEYSRTHKLYPKVVHCNVFHNVPTTLTVTSTKSKTHTVVAETPRTILTETALATTTTTTTLGGAETTVETTILTTSTETSTLSTTVSITTTTSVTVTAQQTSYAQCDPQTNIAGTVNGHGILGVTFNGDLAVGFTRSAYDCCVQCAMSPSCSLAFWHPGECFAVSVQSCTRPRQYSGSTNSAATRPPDSAFFVSNGNCGAFTLDL